MRAHMFDDLPEEQNDREAHRSLILALAGFSFSALLALVVLDATLRHDFHFAVYYLLVSFLCYFFALNLQGYKHLRWHDQVGTALMDAASLCLILAIVSIIVSAKHEKSLYLGLSGLAVFIWLLDYVIRLLLLLKYLKSKGVKNVGHGKQENA